MSELDAVADVAQITDHVAGGVGLLMDRLRKGVETWQGAWTSSRSYDRGDLVASDGSAWRALRGVASGGSAPSEGAVWTEETGLPVALLSLVAALLLPAQELEDAAFPLVALTIDDAEDHALTQIGDLVGLRRADATQITDARYRVALKAWIRAMLSNGTVPDVEEVVTILAGSALSSAWTLDEVFPAGMLVEPTAALLTDDGYVGAVARAVRAAGVRLTVLCPPSGDAFTFADGDEEEEADADLGWADLSGDEPVDGGELAGVVD